jgi:Xaa-Pro aminopeptidase
MASLPSLSQSDKKERLSRLRQCLRSKNLSGFLIPHEDEYQNEMVAPYAERLAWLTDFTGSAGLAIVLEEKAALFVDGRYTTQVQSSVDPQLFSCESLNANHIREWLAIWVPPGSVLGYDPSLHRLSSIHDMEKILGEKGSRMTPTVNLIDEIWTDQPPKPSSRVWSYPLACAGEDVPHKIKRLQNCLKDKKQDGYFLTDPQSICWLLNIRASDVVYTPIVLAYAFVPVSGVVLLFADLGRISEDVCRSFQSHVSLEDPKAIAEKLASIIRSGEKILLHKATASAHWNTVFLELGAHILWDEDPLALMRAVKNLAELDGMRQAHSIDGRAVIRFLHWFSQNACTGTVTEQETVHVLEAFRHQDKSFLEPSFPTIAAWGPHGAMPHYRPMPETNKKITDGLFVLDSGGQYLSGTTDITRTLVVGDPTSDMCACFTRVLKGHIALAKAVFPVGTTGTQLDALARYFLWEMGYDYDHGTGHGVGSCLSVHEGPQRISRHAPIPLEIGMILSNEPGYYRAGCWGIRIENLIAVQRSPLKSENNVPHWLNFEMLSFVPFERRLIMRELLSREEEEWINAYHRKTWELHAPHLSCDERSWLEFATRGL